MSSGVVPNPVAARSLFEVLPGCPPKICTLLCENSQQENWYLNWKQYYIDLNHLLTCYFSGDVPPEYMNPEYRTGLHLGLFRLLRLYDLIFVGWKYLKLDRHTPSDILKDIVLRESFHTFMACKARFSEYSPRGARKDIKFLNDCIQTMAGGESLSNIEVSKFRAFKVKQKSQEVEVGWLDVEQYCWFTLMQLKNPPTEIKNALKAFNAAESDIERWITKHQHPRKARKGHRIIKGVRLPM